MVSLITEMSIIDYILVYLLWFLNYSCTHIFPFQDDLEASQEGAVALVAVVNEENPFRSGVPFET